MTRTVSSISELTPEYPKKNFEHQLSILAQTMTLNCHRLSKECLIMTVIGGLVLTAALIVIPILVTSFDELSLPKSNSNSTII